MPTYKRKTGPSAFGNALSLLKGRASQIDRATDQALRGNEVHQIQSDHDEDDGGIIMTKKKRK